MEKLFHTKNVVCIYPTPSPWTECDIRSIFKQSTTGLNLDFSISLIGCQNKAKKKKKKRKKKSLLDN